MSASKQTEKWIQEVVIKYDLCPFAHNLIHHYQELESLDSTESAAELFEQSRAHTGFLIFPNLEISFADFYDYAQDMNHIIQRMQIVAFHPKFQFDGVEEDNRANYVNRSLYPTLHLIRQHDMDKARIDLNQAESISLNNEKKLNKLSQNEFQEIKRRLIKGRLYE